MIEVYPVGTRVKIDGQYEALVLTITIRSNDNVLYLLAMSPEKEVYVESWRLEANDKPIKIGFK